MLCRELIERLNDLVARNPLVADYPVALTGDNPSISLVGCTEPVGVFYNTTSVVIVGKVDSAVVRSRLCVNVVE